MLYVLQHIWTVKSTKCPVQTVTLASFPFKFGTETDTFYCKILVSPKVELRKIDFEVWSMSYAALWSFGLNQFPSHKGHCQHKELFLFFDNVSSHENRFSFNSHHLCLSGGGEVKEEDKVRVDGKQWTMNTTEPIDRPVLSPTQPCAASEGQR